MTHLREIPAPRLAATLAQAGHEKPEPFARQLVLAMYRDGARTWDELPVSKQKRAWLEERFSFGPLLPPAEVRVAGDGTQKVRFGDVEVVVIRNRTQTTLCVSSQVGCALGCTFCATGALGLRRNLTAGEIVESVQEAQRVSGRRVTDVVFMGQGEPLQNYDAVMDACDTLHARRGLGLSRKRISVSTSGVVPAMRRFVRERRPWRLYLSLHSAIQETRERLMPVARRWPLPEVIAVLRLLQSELRFPWLTLQYVAIPDVNMDDRHVDALGRELKGLRTILNVVPFNDVGAGYRPPTWAEVKDFTTRLRRLRCPVKVRYSAGKRDGMGCGQLSAELIAHAPAGGHVDAPPGIFTG